MTDLNAFPGRRLEEARKLQRAKRLTDPLYLDLLRERFGTSVWWTDKPSKRPNLTDRRIQQFLQAAGDDEEVSPDGLVQDGRLVPKPPQGVGDSAA